MDYSKAVIDREEFRLCCQFMKIWKLLESRFSIWMDCCLAGGEIQDPVLYGEDCLQNVGNITPERDAFELAILEEFLKTEKPILGICRGLQLANVYYGGTLYQDISLTQKIQHRQTWL